MKWVQEDKKNNLFYIMNRKIISERFLDKLGMTTRIFVLYIEKYLADLD